MQNRPENRKIVDAALKCVHAFAWRDAGYVFETFGSADARIPNLLPGSRPAAFSIDPLNSDVAAWELVVGGDEVHLTAVAFADDVRMTTLMPKGIDPVRQTTLSIPRAQWDGDPAGCFGGMHRWISDSMAMPNAGLRVKDSARFAPNPYEFRRKRAQNRESIEFQGERPLIAIYEVLQNVILNVLGENLKLRWGWAQECPTAQLQIFAGAEPLELGQEAKLIPNLVKLLVHGRGKGDATLSARAAGLFEPKTRSSHLLIANDIAILSALRRAEAETILIAPSALYEILQHRWLAKALYRAIRQLDAESRKIAISGLIAMLLLEDDLTQTRAAMARFSHLGDWASSNWGAILDDQDQRTQLLRRLASDPGVADIDRHWGEGRAHRLGQELAASLRVDTPQAASLRRFNIDSAVHGRA